jgi:CheY-like chemotaxis protein
MPPPGSQILLVDDDEAFRYAGARTLENAGFRVTVAPDYRRALEVLESDDPIDLLVTDVVMPDRINGFALARMARMRRIGLRVLYVSAYEIQSDEAIGKILSKPLSDDQFLLEVREALASPAG